MDVDEDLKKELICFYTDILVIESKTKELFVRRDYKEMTELSLMLLGGKLPDDKSFSFKKCGARHKRRFMAFGIYCQKMFISVNKKLLEEIRNSFSTKVTMLYSGKAREDQTQAMVVINCISQDKYVIT